MKSYTEPYYSPLLCSANNSGQIIEQTVYLEIKLLWALAITLVTMSNNYFCGCYREFKKTPFSCFFIACMATKVCNKPYTYNLNKLDIVTLAI